MKTKKSIKAIDKLIKRHKGEQDIYERLMAIRHKLKQHYFRIAILRNVKFLNILNTLNSPSDAASRNAPHQCFGKED